MPASATIADLARQLEDMGVSGRHVMVHASYKLLAPVEDGPAGVVEAFVRAVGDGVLLFPTFDFSSFTERGYWDRDRSPSRMGVITETARRDGRFRRTYHPMLSFAVRWQGLPVVGLPGSPNAHGAGSVFASFIENDGLLVSIGADKQTGFKADDVGFTTCVHAAVEAEAPWRTMKVFTGTYVDGGSSIRSYSASVTRDPAKHVTAVTPGHLEAERQGVIRRAPLGATECWVADARAFHEFAVVSHREDPGLWVKCRRL